ncbi:lytic transglycosylase [Sodalis ligni]|nr:MULTISPECIES: lytic transglycosylase [Sodalis]QWA13832.1 lytic transglycosylase [Sodalis ligni]
MPGGEEFILRPVKAGLTTMGEIKSGAIDLCDIAMLNDYLDLVEDNNARIARWRQANER